MPVVTEAKNTLTEYTGVSSSTTRSEWRSLVGYSPRGHRESDTTEPLNTLTTVFILYLLLLRIYKVVLTFKVAQ